MNFTKSRDRFHMAISSKDFAIPASAHSARDSKFKIQDSI
jgi:hypothetical protein